MRATDSRSDMVFADLVESLGNAELGLLFDRIISSQPRLLLVGETGTGKSSLVRHLYTKAIERGKIGEKQALVVLNMAAIPTELAESTLFGHVRGAYTSATHERQGAFADARGGVLFLDEIHYAPPTVQRKLLVAIQDREYSRLGDSVHRRQRLDAWIIAGTTQPALIETELRHRLGDFILKLKPLRQRHLAFAAIVNTLLERITRERWPQRMQGQAIEIASAEAISWLAEQPWPGNIRELESVLRTASFFVAEPRAGIRFDQLEKAYEMRLISSAPEVDGDSGNTNPPELELSPQQTLQEAVRALLASRTEAPTLEMWKQSIAGAYEQETTSKAAAARALAIDIKTFNKLLLGSDHRGRD